MILFMELHLGSEYLVGDPEKSLRVLHLFLQIMSGQPEINGFSTWTWAETYRR